MRLSLLTIFALFTLLQARENPFKPVIDDTVLPLTSNQVKKAPPFKSTNVTMPNDARVLTSIVIYYQSLDGSIKKRVVPVDRSIDWHRPIVISQAPPLRSRSVSQTSVSQTETLRKEGASKKGMGTKRIRPLPFVSLELEEKRIRIVTEDPKIRSFHLSRPFKVAIDFRREAGFLTKHIPLNEGPFKAIDIGNHKGYYRIVVTLDAPYRYTIVKVPGGYELRLP
ncbi:AMIN domain-containing protein [Hydrogenimonas sp.]